jgi:hypothetical protein
LRRRRRRREWCGTWCRLVRSAEAAAFLVRPAERAVRHDGGVVRARTRVD